MNPRVLVRLRESHALTQHEAAEQIGVSLRQYARWESGEAVPGPKNMRAIADAFGIAVQLLDEDPAPVSVFDALERIEARLAAIEDLLRRRE
jgi:transcriptional regulator with XRE-family HTH domain